MPIFAPLKLTLYDPETDEVKAEYTRSYIPWKIAKKATRLMKSLKGKAEEDMTDEDYDATAGLVIEIFGDKFTVQDLDNGSDLDEMMAVISSIEARLAGISPNPHPKGK